jgi:hemerythrin superfamily protein
VTNDRSTADDDVIAEIVKDHQEIKRLFSEVEQSNGGSKRDAFNRLLTKLAVHETAEEEVVHPAVRSAARDVVEQRLSEEDKGKKLLHELEEMGVDDPRFAAAFQTLEQEVLRHASNEERDEHPVLRSTVDQDKLRSMAKVYRAAEATAPTHPHPNSPESAIGNMVVGPVVAVIDRARDAIRRMRESDKDERREDGGASPSAR